LIKQLLINKKGTAEVIGSVMFIVILLFFFTNVYLWHDAATKEMNDLYVQKLNSPIVASVTYENGHYILTITNRGGIDATLSSLWVAEQLSGHPDVNHSNFNNVNNVVVAAGDSHSFILNLPFAQGSTLHFQVVTTAGNSASFTLEP
jgi:hypothetical protein